MTSGSSLPTPLVPPRDTVPSGTAVPPVLRRARDGVVLNVDEAAVALSVRGRTWPTSARAQPGSATPV